MTKQNNLIEKVKTTFTWMKTLLADIKELQNWVYKESMLGKSSFLWAWFKKKKVPFKELLIIPLGLFEWFLSACTFAMTLLFKWMAVPAMTGIPLTIIAIPVAWIIATIQYFTLNQVNIDPFSLIIYLPVLALFLWLLRQYVNLFQKIRPALEKVRK